MAGTTRPTDHTSTTRTRRAAARRRQRSVRVLVASLVLLLSSAAAVGAVVAAEVVGTAGLVAALALSVVCGWVALRIVVVELRQQRREHARERARLARGFHDEIARQLGDRREAVSAARRRGDDAERGARELEAALRLLEARAGHAEHRAREEALRGEEARERLRELEVALAIRSAEDADELATWDAAGGHEVRGVGASDGDRWQADTVVDLLSWSPTERSA